MKQLLLLLFFFSLVAKAQDGILDNSFGTNGIQTTSIGSGDDQCYDVAIQNDGRIIMVGNSNNGTDYDFAVVRYNSNGSLDNSFGTNGILITAIGTGNDNARSVVFQKDDKILVAGYSHNGTDYDFVVARYNVDGTLDNSFGTNGIQTTDLGGSDICYSVLIQDDDKIVLAGYGGSYEFAAVRYNADGTLDNSFGTNGIQMITQTGYFTFAQSAALQTDGKIIIAGYSIDLSTGIAVFSMTRLNTDGTLDNSFGTDGIQTTDFGGLSALAYSVSIQTDGKILLVGYSTSDGIVNKFALARYDTVGILDNTFGNDGMLVTDAGGGNNTFYSSKFQSDGKIVAGGFINDGSGFDGNDFGILRYTADGILDTSFSTDGIQTTAIGLSNDNGQSVAIQNDGKIVLAGYYKNGVNTDFAVVRYLGTPVLPTVTTDSSSNITNESATVYGIVNSHGNDSSTVRFLYGTVTGTYTDSIDATPSKVGGASNTPVSGMLSGLMTNQTYFYTISAMNNAGYVQGIEMSFTTNAVVADVQTDSVSNVLETEATVYGTINPNNSETTVRFLYGTTSGTYTDSVDATPSTIDGTSSTSVSATLSSLTMNTTYYYCVAATNGAGYVRGTEKDFTTIITSVLTDTEVPRIFQLAQNYPNPFNPSTTITFTVAEQNHTTLIVYNLLGQQVTELFNDIAVVGKYYHITFDGGNLSSGIYMIRLISGENVQMRKMILMK